MAVAAIAARASLGTVSGYDGVVGHHAIAATASAKVLCEEALDLQRSMQSLRLQWEDVRDTLNSMRALIKTKAEMRTANRDTPSRDRDLSDLGKLSHPQEVSVAKTSLVSAADGTPHWGDDVQLSSESASHGDRLAESKEALEPLNLSLDEDGVTIAKDLVDPDDLSVHSSSSPVRKCTSVTFDDDACTSRYSVQPFEAHTPAHGHWLPHDFTNQRGSFQNECAKALGGRRLTLETGEAFLGSVECILVEPMGKVLSPSEYIGTGLMVCLVGAEKGMEVFEEWAYMLKHTKLLDAGISFAIPILECADGSPRPCDIDAVVLAALVRSGLEKCLLMGKGWGARRAIELAASSGKVAGKIAGVIVVAPGDPVPASCGALECPVLAIWSRSDEVSPYSKSARPWKDVLKKANVPMIWKDAGQGGHDLHELLKKDDQISDAVLHFTCASMLMSDLMKAMHKLREQEEEEESDSTDEQMPLSERTIRLCDELPGCLAVQLSGGRAKDEPGALGSVVESEIERLGPAEGLLRLGQVLEDWFRSDMRPMASASE